MLIDLFMFNLFNLLFFTIIKYLQSTKEYFVVVFFFIPITNRSLMPWLIPFGRDKSIFPSPMEAQITYSSKSPILWDTLQVKGLW